MSVCRMSATGKRLYVASASLFDLFEHFVQVGNALVSQKTALPPQDDPPQI